MRGILLDTHVLIWMAEKNRRLGRRATALVVDRASDLWLSSVSVWEIASKARLGSLRLSISAARWLPDRMRENDITPLALTHEHAITAAELPRYHEDPFDRMLIAQAQVE